LGKGRVVRAIGDVILEIDEALTGLNVEHVFGGALALAYYAEPRGTVDIDINVGVSYGSRSVLLTHLDNLGWHADELGAGAAPAAGTRLHQTGESVVIDLFFSFDDYHEDVFNRAVAKPFVHAGGRYELQFLSAEDLVIFKISFGRPKDWVDIQAMVAADTVIDPDYVERQLLAFKGPTAYPASARFRALLRGEPA
jgi:hypothetical protein